MAGVFQAGLRQAGLLPNHNRPPLSNTTSVQPPITPGLSRNSSTQSTETLRTSKPSYQFPPEPPFVNLPATVATVSCAKIHCWLALTQRYVQRGRTLSLSSATHERRAYSLSGIPSQLSSCDPHKRSASQPVDPFRLSREPDPSRDPSPARVKPAAKHHQTDDNTSYNLGPPSMRIGFDALPEVSRVNFISIRVDGSELQGVIGFKTEAGRWFLANILDSKWKTLSTYASFILPSDAVSLILTRSGGTALFLSGTVAMQLGLLIMKGQGDLFGIGLNRAHIDLQYVSGQARPHFWRTQRLPRTLWKTAIDESLFQKGRFLAEVIRHHPPKNAAIFLDGPSSLKTLLSDLQSDMYFNITFVRRPQGDRDDHNTVLVSNFPNYYIICRLSDTAWDPFITKTGRRITAPDNYAYARTAASNALPGSAGIHQVTNSIADRLNDHDTSRPTTMHSENASAAQPSGRVVCQIESPKNDMRRPLVVSLDCRLRWPYAID